MNSRPKDLWEVSHVTFIIKLRQNLWFSNKLLWYMTNAGPDLQACYLTQHTHLHRLQPPLLVIRSRHKSGEHPRSSASSRETCVGQNSRVGLMITSLRTAHSVKRTTNINQLLKTTHITKYWK